MVGIILPASLRVLEILPDGDYTPDVAVLSRLTRLETLEMSCWNPIPQQLPQLPVLRTFIGVLSDLQLLTPVASTLENLELSGGDLDFEQPMRFTNFTCLRKLHLSFFNYTPLVPTSALLPPNLPSMTMAWPHDLAPSMDSLREFIDNFGQIVVNENEHDDGLSLTFNCS